ncbi:hypothetical protein NKR23_g11637 [Pleurostoma richardsiae]|uniref:DUF5672 domain-containing protein n=1 Tax=Pleurostoma richardsiae TaxID=41990 RepID=A0AA38VJT6_9PEZI|nr:hypothetical protein NKR23_g11637 [Pleurostoma richardsiae]
MAAATRKDDLEDITMGDLWDTFKGLLLAIWGKTSRRMRLGAAFLIFLGISISLAIPTIRSMEVPTLSLEYASQNRSPFNESKVALLVENRAFPLLAPLMLHFMAVVPPDWRFRFMGSVDSVEHLNKSVAIREQVNAGKLDLTYIPSNMSTGSQEEISRFLTNLWLYEVVLQPAEWLLIFQTDSILCANSPRNLNEFLDYDWVGAPWNPEGRFGGNGGLSLRRVSAIIDVLRHQERVPGSEPEDVWLADRLGHRPGAKLANGTVALTFSGEMYPGKPEHLLDKTAKGKKYNSSVDAAADGNLVSGIDDWREGFYEPMGYHTGGSGNTLHSGIWGTPALRKHIWEYCPEVKMTLNMDAAKYVPGDCFPNWKRDLEGGAGAETEAPSADLGWGTEVIDGVEYPLLHPGIRPW